MTLREFNALKFNEQIEKVYKDGVYIADRTEREFTIVLYELDDICVELYYDEREGDPFTLKSFICKERFELTLQEVA